MVTPHAIPTMSYANTSVNKTRLWRYRSVTSAGGNGEVGGLVGLWRSTNAITSIEVSAFNAVNFKSGSTFSLYGIKAA